MDWDDEEDLATLTESPLVPNGDPNTIKAQIDALDGAKKDALINMLSTQDFPNA